MKEVLIKFETEELYREFLDKVVNTVNSTDSRLDMTYDFSDDIMTIKNKPIEKEQESN